MSLLSILPSKKLSFVFSIFFGACALLFISVLFAVPQVFSQQSNFVGWSGDANGDGVVNQLDYQQVLNAFGQTAGPSDLNLDQIVNIFDLNIVITQYGQMPPPLPSVPPPTVTPTPAPSGMPPTPTPIPSAPPPTSQTGIWVSPQELAQLPMSGVAWENLEDAAETEITNPNIYVRDYKNTYVLAKALVYARNTSHGCGNHDGLNCRQQVRQLLEEVMGTVGTSGDVLAVVRNTSSYVIAADLIDLKNYGDGFDQQFRAWASNMLDTEVGNTGGCQAIAQCHNKRPNNFGTHAGASRIAIALYLNDQQELQDAIQVYKGWLGDRSSYIYEISNFGELGWQADPTKPVGINPAGSTIQGKNVDGVLPDDQRRCSTTFVWPPCKDNYVWEALQGAVVTAEMLHRKGYDAYNWENQALLRAYNWLYDPDAGGPIAYPWYSAITEDRWQPWIVNKRYNTNFPTEEGITPGKAMGWSDWTHP